MTSELSNTVIHTKFCKNVLIGQKVYEGKNSEVYDCTYKGKPAVCKIVSYDIDKDINKAHEQIYNENLIYLNCIIQKNPITKTPLSTEHCTEYFEYVTKKKDVRMTRTSRLLQGQLSIPHCLYKVHNHRRRHCK